MTIAEKTSLLYGIISCNRSRREYCSRREIIGLCSQGSLKRLINTMEIKVLRSHFYLSVRT